MSEPLKETRVPIGLQVRVWGMDVDGHAFFQHAQTSNISRGGALIGGIKHDLRVGETIGVQYGDKKARCRVVWANAGLLETTRAGVKLLEGECPWGPELAKTVEPVAGSNCRRWPRHRIPFLIELHEDCAAFPMRVTSTDVSASGCYVETILPLALGTSLHVDFWNGSEKVTTRAFVRTRDPGVGMGIEFIGLKYQDQGKFQSYLEALDPWASSIECSHSERVSRPQGDN